MTQHTFEGGKVFESITLSTHRTEVPCEPGYGGLYPSEKDMGMDVIGYVQLTETPKTDNRPPNRKQRRREARKKR